MREVARRQERFGHNTIPSGKRFRLLFLFLDRFRDTLVIILLVAAVFSIAIGHFEDAIVIGIAILLDALLSFAQVWRTEKALAQMRQQVADTISVIRDAETRTIPSSELVPGDIIEFRAGERVPADARLIRAQGIRVQEAALTGESTDVQKDIKAMTTRTAISNQANMIFTGTTVVAGNGAAVVTATGTRTEFGKIAQMLREQRSPESPLRRKLQTVGIKIGWMIIGAVALLAIIGLLRGDNLIDTIRTATTLIVSAIPEDLTMILTIALTVGVTRILRRGGVVRKLSSGETLGAATVICTDKTGTLTAGKMTATSLNFLQGDVLLPDAAVQEPMHKLALIGMAVTNDAHRATRDGSEYVGSSTERTALAFVEGFGLEQSKLKESWRLRDGISFSPKWKYRAALCDHPTQSTQTLFVMGAPDVLLERSSHALNDDDEPSPLTSERRRQMGTKIEHTASEGHRLLAIAVKPHLQQDEITHKDIHELTFLGILTIQDPVRESVHAAMQETASAGVAVKLITGDMAATARAVASRVGLVTNQDTAITGDELQRMSDEELTRDIDRLSVFARVEPLDKQRVIRILQKKGHVVAMTGDGVNDAVALKGADIGVAMGGGSDIAKDAADLVLIDNSFATIVAAIKEGRVIRDNVRKVIAFLLATNTAEVAIFFVSVFTGLPLPLLPAQVLWINLVTDGTSDIALSLEPAEDDVMKRRPEDPQGSLIGRTLVSHIVFAGLVRTVGTMMLFWQILSQAGADLAYARTMAFTFLSVSSLLSVWSFRSLTTLMTRQNVWTNKWLFASAGFSLALHMVAIYAPALRSFFDTVPLSMRDWMIIFALAAVTVVIVDLRKIIIRSKERSNQPLRPAPVTTTSV